MEIKSTKQVKPSSGKPKGGGKLPNVQGAEATTIPINANPVQIADAGDNTYINTKTMGKVSRPPQAQRSLGRSKNPTKSTKG